MQLTSQKLRELLVEPGHIDGAVFDKAVAEAAEEGISPEQYIVEHNIITNENFGRAVADGMGYRYYDPSQGRIPETVLSELPEEVMRERQAVVFEITDEHIKIATTNPDDPFFDALAEQKGKNVDLYFTTEASIAYVLRHHNGDLAASLSKLVSGLTGADGNLTNVVEFVDSLIELAYNSHVSDIHIEPLPSHVSVRFRIDGVLHEVTSYPKEMHEHIVSRIKILSRLRIDEHAVPQDGRFAYHKEHIEINLRVSFAPVSAGENVVIRLLATRSKHLSLEELGVLPSDAAKILRAAEKPYGMILAVGPTGSGKTTTLYVLLEMLNKPEVNIMTIEDPIEYNIEHVQQMQVNQERDLRFATGLRAIVRQDPDIIMVGEIRDKETADISVNAAMTGHLLLSTMHTNDAATTFPRLAEMEIEPFLAASSLIAIIAQRLIRKICEHCKTSYTITREEMELFGDDREFLTTLAGVAGKQDISEVTLYKGAGCSNCGGTGYLGRTGIFEVMEINESIRALAIKKADAGEINREALRLGMTPMLFDGMTKVADGTTTLIEIIRAIRT